MQGTVYRVVGGISYEKLLPEHKTALVTALLKARQIHNVYPVLLTDEASRLKSAQLNVEASWPEHDFSVVAFDEKTRELVGYYLFKDYVHCKPIPPTPSGNLPYDAWRQCLYTAYQQLYSIIGDSTPPNVIMASTAVGVGVIPEYNSRGIYSTMLDIARETIVKAGYQYELGTATHAKTMRTAIPGSLFHHTEVYEDFCYQGQYPLKGVLPGSATMSLCPLPKAKITHKFPEAIATLNNGIKSRL